MQEWAVGPLGVKEESLDEVRGQSSREHAEVFRDTQQDVKEEVALPGTGIAHLPLLHSPEHQDRAADEQHKTLGVQVNQELLQERAVDSLDVKEESLDEVQGEISREHAEIFRDTQKDVKQEVALPGLGITCPPLSLLPEDQDMAEDEQSKILGVQVDQGMNLRNKGVPFHLLEQSPMQSSQQTMFWKVLQEDSENVDSLGKDLWLKAAPLISLIPGKKLGGSSSYNFVTITLDTVRFASLFQEPLQEWAVGPLDEKDEVQGQSSREHAELFRDTQQDIKEEVALPGLGIQCPTSVFPSKDPDMDEDEMSKALGIQGEQGMILRKMGTPFHMVKTPVQSSQWTMFWKVLQEDGENVDSLEESLGPQHGCAPHPVKKEDTFLLDPVQSQRLPGQDSGDGEGSQLKMENSLLGGNEPVDTPRRGQWRTPENVLVTAVVQEEGCEANREQETEPLRGSRESGELPEGLRAACSNPSSVGGKAFSSTYGRWYHPKSGPVFEHTGEECNEGSQLREKIQPESKLDKHQSSHREEKNHDCPELG
ncbi:hypothetical protein lerEdw1_015808, partial [Lerista edwardsae]